MKTYSEMTFEERSLELERTKEYAFTFLLENMSDYCDTSNDEEVKSCISNNVQSFIENDSIFENSEIDYLSDGKFKEELVEYLYSEYKEKY